MHLVNRYTMYFPYQVNTLAYAVLRDTINLLNLCGIAR
jgi:hypothetical protein